MSRAGKIIVGILSFLPIVLFIGQFFVFFALFYQLFSQSLDPAGTASNETTFLAEMVGLMINMGVIITVGIGMLIYLLMHANTNPKLNDDDRLTWVILLVVLGILIFPVYWYIGIWKEKPIDPIIK